MQNAAETNAEYMDERIKKDISSRTSKTRLLRPKTGEVIIDQSKHLDLLGLGVSVEHYLEMYNTQNDVAKTTLDAPLDLLIMDVLDVLPRVDEFSKVIDCLICCLSLVVIASYLKPGSGKFVLL